MILKQETGVPKEHQELYSKQAKMWNETVDEFRKKYDIDGLQSCLGGDMLRLEISVKVSDKHCLFFHAEKTLSRKALLTTDFKWLKEQFKNYIEEQLLINVGGNASWKLQRGIKILED